ncbi:MAG: DHH family phosphoesterase [Lachnospiraceae bacterium]|nr:DHH family phosphoesterase [Lachnospiraceae bacterium]
MKQRIKIKGAIRRSMLFSIAACIVLLLAGIFSFPASRQVGITLACVSVVFLIIAIVMYFSSKPILVREMVSFATEYAQVQRKILEEMAIPYGLLDRNGRIMWMNHELTGLLPKATKNKSTITTFMPEITKESLGMEQDEVTITIHYEEDIFRAVLKKVDMTNLLTDQDFVELDAESDWMVALCLFEETQMQYLKQEVENRQLMAGLVYIDNYDEVLESVEPVRQSLLLALIDRKVTKYFADYDGIVRKLEKDKYFVAVEHRHLEELTASHFDLLEDVKTINVGNSMSVTLSIAFGLNGAGYNENCEYSRIAMDLALGRGGDQAAVKAGDEVRYYGGASESMEKTTRVKARVKAHALREILQSKDSVMIMGHKIGDTDCLGAGVGVYRMAKLMGKQAYICFEDVNSTMTGLMARFQPEAGYDTGVFVTRKEALEKMDENTLLIVVDVNRPSHTECPELIEKAQQIVVIDHHRQSNEIIENALLKYIEPYASSASELVTEIIQYMFNDVRLKQQEADALYAGIMIDTNYFSNKTGVRTFEACAFLRRKGADVVRVRKLFRDDMADYKARAEAVRSAEIFEESFAIAVCPADEVASPTIVGAQAANELLNIKGVRASFVLTDYNHLIYLSARSVDDVNVQIIMERLGGGGHLNAAGAQLSGCTVQQALDLLKETIRGMLQEGAIR